MSGNGSGDADFGVQQGRWKPADAPRGGSSLLRGAHLEHLRLQMVHVSPPKERSSSAAQAFGSLASIAATIEAPKKPFRGFWSFWVVLGFFKVTWPDFRPEI